MRRCFRARRTQSKLQIIEPSLLVHADTPQNDVVALAGIFQAVWLVQQAARNGEVDESAFATSIKSVFRLDSESALDVFGGIRALEPGFRVLIRQFGRQEGRPDPELTGYVIALMFLERKLVRSASMMDALKTGIRAVNNSEGDDAEPLSPGLVAGLAALYSDTISRLNPRILVHGAPEHLNDVAIANKVRALLLAGMRATVLWRQVGGSRFRLLFGRKRVAAGARIALSRMET